MDTNRPKVDNTRKLVQERIPFSKAMFSGSLSEIVKEIRDITCSDNPTLFTSVLSGGQSVTGWIREYHETSDQQEKRVRGELQVQSNYDTRKDNEVKKAKAILEKYGMLPTTWKD